MIDLHPNTPKSDRLVGVGSHSKPAHSTKNSYTPDTTSTTSHSKSPSDMSWTSSKRDPKQKSAFRKNHPCPSTGKTSGACPGYEVVHRVPY